MTNPVALSTMVWGDGPQRALLLHGLTSAGANWWRVADGLAGIGYTVVAPDLRGHGISPKPTDLSLEAHRDDVLLLGNGWDVLIGHSIGGAIATLALTGRPEFARSVVLEDPALDSTETERLLRDSPEPLANPTIATVAAEHPDWDPLDVELKVQALLQCGVETAPRTMADSSPWDLWDEVQALELPTLLLAADPEQGALVSQERGAAVAAVNPAVEFVLLEGASHSMHRDAFARFFDVVRQFIAG